MKRNISVEYLNNTPVVKQDIEMVERKGIGHPDTIIDGVMEEVSKALCKEYLEEYGKILHHNVDKGLVIGGATRVDWGGGEVLKPIEIILTGRATDEVNGKKIPTETIALRAAKQYLKRNVRHLEMDDNVIFDTKLAAGSKDLVEVFLRGPEIPMANDTSFGVGFAPFSETEKITLKTEELLNTKEYQAKRPAVGEDVKIMAVREKDVIHVTVAAAMVSRHLNHLEEYMELKKKVREDVLANAKKLTDKQVEVYVNTGDDPDHASVYLTYTGTSAEMGDDGSVGRGNRCNGLITPMRPMSLEAPAGKNPVNHVGKIYNVLANEIAFDIVKLYPEIIECNVSLLSQIGKPIDQPKNAGVQLIVEEKDKSEEMKNKVNYIVDGWLEDVTSITTKIVEGEARIY